MVFPQFILFSETRFVEPSHRPYDHFARMFLIIFAKLKRNEEKEQAENIHLRNLLVQLELVVDLLIIHER